MRTIHQLAAAGLSFLMLAFGACSKDNATAAAPDFQPMTAGSSWTYQPSAGTAYTLTVSTRDTTALGKTYKVFTSTNGTNQYRRKSGNEYYQLTVIPTLFPNGFDDLYLKDNQPAGSSWKISQTVTVPSIPLPLVADINYTIKTKDSSMTLSGRSFTKVSRVRMDVSVAGFGNLGGGDFYYADKIGLIRSVVAVGFSGQGVNYDETLVNYTIK